MIVLFRINTLQSFTVFYNRLQGYLNLYLCLNKVSLCMRIESNESSFVGPPGRYTIIPTRIGSTNIIEPLGSITGYDHR